MNGGQVSRGERIPLEIVMPHVQDWIDAWYGVGGEDAPRNEHPYFTLADFKREHPEWKHTNESLAVLALASASGVQPSAIGRWLRQWKTEGGTVGYFDADALFTGMHQTGLWARDPELRALRDACVGEACTLPEPTTEGTS